MKRGQAVPHLPLQARLTSWLAVLCRTYTTSYTGTVGSSSSGSSDSGGGANGEGSSSSSVAGPGDSGSGSGRWGATGEAINRTLLTSRDPILYYDELPLYESELDDHGSSRVTVKVNAAGLRDTSCRCRGRRCLRQPWRRRPPGCCCPAQVPVQRSGSFSPALPLCLC